MLDYLFDKFSYDHPVTVRDRDLCGSDEPWVGGKHLLDDELKKLSPMKVSRFNINIACGARQRASCIKRRWTPSSYDDEGIPNKRLRAQQETVLFQCANNTLHIVESEREIIEFLSSLFTEDESIQNKQQRAEEEAFLVQNNQAIELSCSINILQISDTCDVEQCLSILDEILELDCTEDSGDEGVQNKQQRAGKEVLFVQENELPWSDDILQIVEFEGEMESLAEDCFTFDVEEEFLSILDDECILSK